jgi:tetratricopeptide (TPR) repeat protein
MAMSKLSRTQRLSARGLIRACGLISACGLLSACGTVDNLLDGPPPPTLADLEPAALPPAVGAPPPVSLPEMAQIYRDVLLQQQDAQTRLHVSHRLADIEMLGAEERLTASDTGATDFSAAIAAYESLLEEHPDYARKDQLLYQLSKAYALDGRPDASLASLQRLAAHSPDSPYLPEAYFRQAERRFVANDYDGAQALYARVIDYGNDTPYFTRALYMQGWSRFKLNDYDGAVAAFTDSIDQSLPGDIPVDTLSRAEQELVTDSLRVLAIVFDKQQGVDSIESAFERSGPRPWEYLAYESLGQLYLTQERYGDSARTYQAYIAQRPSSGRAHRFHVRVIEAYEAGGFAAQVVDAKRDYVAAFTVGGDYWRDSDAGARSAIEGRLKTYLPELARHHHALAQAGQKAEQQQADYAEAAHFYRLYLDSFPQDAESPRLAFLLAESLYEAGDYPAAIDAYEVVAYHYGDPANAADAAYTAILAQEKLLAQTGQDEDLQRRRIDSELRFQASFPTDTRAPGVLGHAATALLQLQDYPAALDAATTLVSLLPPPDRALLAPAWLVIGHSQFALAHYPSAEAAYGEALTVLAPEDERTPDTTERLAAAIYRQGEQAARLGDDALAASHFQRAMKAAPGTDIGTSAQFDAAQALVRAGELEDANALLRDFRRRHADNALSAGIGATLLANYEQLQQWDDAARELDRMRDTGELEGDAARQALLVSAQYYRDAGDAATAIERYRSYAHDWPEPVGENLEAINTLAGLYRDAGETDKRAFWLRRTMAIHDGAGAAQSDRTRYLAASAAAELANGAFTTFTSLGLSLPMNESLPAKKRAMEQAIAGYNRCNAYAVQQFVTRCTYQLGTVYQRFSAELMDSPRPAGLDALALEQYDIMLEEQAFPFEEKAIDLHESNAQRIRNGAYDQWTQSSLASLAQLLPARYRKQETLALENAEASPATRDFNREAIGLREQGEFDAAEGVYLAALNVEQDDALTHYNLGILYDLYLGIPDRAIRHYRRYQAAVDGEDRRVAGWIADLERRHMQVAGEAP